MRISSDNGELILQGLSPGNYVYLGLGVALAVLAGKDCGSSLEHDSAFIQGRDIFYLCGRGFGTPLAQTSAVVASMD